MTETKLNDIRAKLQPTHLLLGVILAVCLLLGLKLIHTGMTDLLEIYGQDVAIPGDEVGELDIQETRQIKLRPEAVLALVGGLGLSGGSLWGARKIEEKIKPR